MQHPPFCTTFSSVWNQPLIPTPSQIKYKTFHLESQFSVLVKIYVLYLSHMSDEKTEHRGRDPLQRWCSAIISLHVPHLPPLCWGRFLSRQFWQSAFLFRNIVLHEDKVQQRTCWQKEKKLSRGSPSAQKELMIEHGPLLYVSTNNHLTALTGVRVV